MQVLNKQTLIPVGAVIATLVMAFSIAVAVRKEEKASADAKHEQQIKLLAQQHAAEMARVRRDNDINAQLTEIRAQLASIRSQLEAATADRWHRRDMKIWSGMLRTRNPEIDVPAVDEID